MSAFLGNHDAEMGQYGRRGVQKWDNMLCRNGTTSPLKAIAQPSYFSTFETREQLKIACSYENRVYWYI